MESRGSSSKFTEVTSHTSTPRNAEVKDSLAQAEVWAALLLPHLCAAPPLKTLGIFPSTETTAMPEGGPKAVPVPLPHSQEPSTAQSERVIESQTSDTPGVNQEGPTRLVLEVASEALGRVQLVIDREATGLRVVIGSSDSVQGLLSADKYALTRALGLAGVPVQSLEVVPTRELGTVLAQGEGKRGKRSEGQPASPPERAREGRKRRIDLIG